MINFLFSICLPTLLLIVSLPLFAGEPDQRSYAPPLNFLTPIPDTFFLPVMEAASYFESLEGVNIRLKERPIRTTLNVRPAFFSNFRRPAKRTYVIRINNKEIFSGITLDEVPHKAQVGIWGHEFSHILDFQQKSTFGLLHTGFRYIFPRSRSAYEKKIDELTIQMGLGEELLEWKHFLYHESSVQRIYLDFKRNIYYTPSEIDSLLQIHRDTLNY